MKKDNSENETIVKVSSEKGTSEIMTVLNRKHLKLDKFENDISEKENLETKT